MSAKLALISLNHKDQAWIEEGCAEYLRRMSETMIEKVLRPPSRALGKSVAAIKMAEAVMIKKSLQSLGAQRFIALDVVGKTYNTAQLSQKINGWIEQGGLTAFVVGGADGMDAGLLQEADLRLSLSPLTLPHGMARMMMLEQIYRCLSLLKGHPYHRAE